jgi:class 3 adenylate cyclase/tetratricopeptide (TPR) repeat protein
VRCPRCATENPQDARFCVSCGNQLARTCANCGRELPDGATFCPHCGHPVDAPADADDRLRRFIPEELLAKLNRAAERDIGGERRRVTMLFCDVQGSTAAAENLDPEEWADIMNGAFEHLIAPIYRYEGTLARLMGDAILAFFGAPISHEDDPERAVRAGLEILAEIEPYKRQVRRDWGLDIDIRVGINTGLVVVGAVGSDLRVEYTAMGDAVNVAARMEQTAAPGTVQVSTDTKRLVERLFVFEDLGEVEVKGRTEPVGAHRVVRPLGRPTPRRGIEGLRAPLIGRQAELDVLQQALADLTSSGAGRIVSIMGEAGLGKSRLVAEMREGLEASGSAAQVQWCEGRSLSFETTTPFAPIREVVRQLAGIRDEDDAARARERLQELAQGVVPGRARDIALFLAGMLGLELPDDDAARLGFFPTDQLRGETFRAVTEVVAGVAGRRPLVLVLEDLHWADSATVDLVTQLLDTAERAPLLLLLAFRPRRDDPSWTVHEQAEREHPHLHVTIELAPLGDDATRDLVASLLEVDGLPERVRSTILDRSEGNPYFVEEVIRSMIDQDLIRRDGERWTATAEIGQLVVPDALSALVTSRLDRLDDGAKDVAQAASVLGREFRYDELVAVLGDVAGLDDALIELQRREFLREVARVPKRRFRFKHSLMQEAIYETVLLRTRSQLHAAAADLLEQLQPERVEDIAEHLLRGRQVERAIPYLLDAGKRALRAHALPEAQRRFEQVIDVLADSDDPDLLRRALEGLGQAKELAFDFEGAIEVYTRLRDEGERREDTPMWISGQNKLAFITGIMLGQRVEALADLTDAESRARNADDELGLVEACMKKCYLHTLAAEFDEVEHYMREVKRLGSELDDDEAFLFGLSHLAATSVYLTRFDEGLVRAEEALAKAEEIGHLKFQAELLVFAIPTCHMRNGDMEAAIAAIERGMEIALRIGSREDEAFAAAAQGRLAMLRGDLEDALASLRRAGAAADATGVPMMQAMGLCLEGSCYLQIGGPLIQRALELHTRTLELMSMPTGSVLTTWLQADMALCALEAGDLDLAADLVDGALHTQNATMYLMRPQALLAASRLALAQGRPDDARAHVDELETYVAERQMQDQAITAGLARAVVEAETGNHAEAVEHLERCADIAASTDLARVLLDVRALQARSLDALGRDEEAATVRSDAEGIVDRIASSFHDPDLRAAFLSGSRKLLAGSGAG